MPVGSPNVSAAAGAFHLFAFVVFFPAHRSFRSSGIQKDRAEFNAAALGAAIGPLQSEKRQPLEQAVRLRSLPMRVVTSPTEHHGGGPSLGRNITYCCLSCHSSYYAICMATNFLSLDLLDTSLYPSKLKTHL